MIDAPPVKELTIRGGRASDAGALGELFEAQAMGPCGDPTEFVVVECAGTLAGAARAERLAGQTWLRPIVVEPSLQRRGIGSILLTELLYRHESLCLVARGGSAQFYRRHGFAEMSWDEVAPSLRAECEECPDRVECHPLPMRHA